MYQEQMQLSQAEQIYGTRPINYHTGRSLHWFLIHSLALRPTALVNTGSWAWLGGWDSHMPN